MHQKATLQNDRLCHPNLVFAKEKELNLRWQRTKLQVTTWEELCDHFMRIYSSDADYTTLLEKLLRRQQQHSNLSQLLRWRFDMILGDIGRRLFLWRYQSALSVGESVALVPSA